MANKKYINTPRGYLSQSQIEMWESDPKRYKEIYFNARPEFQIQNKEMSYGSKFADSLEHDKETGDVLLDTAGFLLKKYEVRDKEMTAEMKTKNGWVKLLGKPDTFNPVNSAFREYKTGKTKWTQKKADNHFQLKYYATIIYLNTKMIPADVQLDWVETHDTSEGVQPTGRIESFPVKITLGDILKTMARTKRVAEEIERAWAMHITKPIKPF